MGVWKEFEIGDCGRNEILSPHLPDGTKETHETRDRVETHLQFK
jgi:hypothetical protein